jgi:hypothetical protein
MMPGKQPPSQRRSERGISAGFGEKIFLSCSNGKIRYSYLKLDGSISVIPFLKI